MKTKTIISVIIIFSAMGCSEYLIPPAPDYSSEQMWFIRECCNSKPADVFYITPTCIWDWKNASEDVSHFMDPYNKEQRDAADGANNLALALFSKSCNFYSPYYRQITMESWMVSPKETDNRYKNAHQDIVKAFDYYMKYYNHGRPFILAGHSQGAKAVLELLKHTVSKKQLENMIAAYIFGFEITREELDTYKTLKPACNSSDYGTIVCYNSSSSPAAVSPLFKKNAVCINPVNWRTDNSYAHASENTGSVFFKKDGTSDTLFGKVSAHIDTLTKTVIVDGLDDDDYYIPSIGELFPKGNYHVMEINLYFLNLQKNIQQRIDNFYLNNKINNIE